MYNPTLTRFIYRGLILRRDVKCSPESCSQLPRKTVGAVTSKAEQAVAVF